MKSIFITIIIFPFLLFCSAQEKKELPKSSDEIIISDGWARPGKAGMMSAAYFKIINGTSSADTLFSVESDASTNTQIHLSFQNEDGLMSMEEQPYVVIPAQSEVEFKQGGLHVMIIQPTNDLLEGDSLSLKLFFNSMTKFDLKVPIRSFN
ncbi:MAG: copper chaperone PCu(A)C [Balneolaceae bacterium]